MTTSAQYPIAINQLLQVESPRQVPVTCIVVGYDEERYMKLCNVRNAFEGLSIDPDWAQRIASTPEGDTGIKMLNKEGVMEDNAASPEKAAKAITAPIKAAKVIPAPTALADGTTVTTATPTPFPTKKERAAAIKAANPTLTRKDGIALFMKEIGMSHACASTYWAYK